MGSFSALLIQSYRAPCFLKFLLLDFSRSFQNHEMDFRFAVKLLRALFLFKRYSISDDLVGLRLSRTVSQVQPL